MRLCVVGNSAHQHVLRWTRHYVARGHDVHVVSVWDAPVGGATCHRIGGGAHARLRRVASYLTLLRSLGPVLDRIRPDLVQAHFAYTYGAAVARAGFHPFMLVTLGSDVLLPRWWERLVRPLAAQACRAADLIVGASEAQLKAARRLGATCPVHRLAHGVDLSRFRREAPDRNGLPFRIGIFKDLRPLYGHRDLIDAFARVVERHPDAQLVVAGDGPLRATLEAQARSLSLGGRVAFIGRVPHESVPRVMAGLDAVALTSYSEGLPNMLLEAFAMGIPAVATRVGGVPEVVLEGETGLLVPPGDPLALAAAIARLIEHPEARARMGRTARQRVRDRHDCRTSLERMEQLCLSLVGDASPGRDAPNTRTHA